VFFAPIGRAACRPTPGGYDGAHAAGGDTGLGVTA
jgi:hypothetical protein